MPGDDNGGVALPLPLEQLKHLHEKLSAEEREELLQ